MKSRVISIAGLLFVTGMCALIFQVAWLREFRLVFGASTTASAAVLAIFMGCLGLGNAWLGPRADRHPNPLAYFSTLVFLISVSAAATPFLIDITRSIYVGMGGQMVLGVTGATIARVLLATAVLAAPTVLMGGTLPAAARAATSVSDRHRLSLALLYGLNTLGAVLGAALSTFFLLETFGSRMTLWLACGVNVAVALIARVLSRHSPQLAEISPDTAAEPSEASEQFADVGPAWRPTVVQGAALVVGFAFFLMELVWYRMLGPLLGGTTFTFGLILAVALFGIGLGGAAYTLIFRAARPTFRNFAITCGLEAALVAYPFAMGDHVAILTATLREEYATSFAGLIWAWTAIAVLVILPAAFVSGVQFPLLIALLGHGSKDLGKQVGRAFAWNTVGAIAGSLVGGFGILPLLSAPGAWRLGVAILCGLGVVMLLISLRHEGRSLGSLVPALLFVLAAGLLLPVGPTSVWRHSAIGAGRAKFTQATPNAMQDWMNGRRRDLLWEADGLESSVAIIHNAGLAFVINGKVDGHSTGDATTQIMFALVGAALHPEPKTSLVIGLGTGESAGWLAEVGSMQRVDVVELEPVIDEIAARCAIVNHDVLNHPKVNRIYNDAREVLLTTPERYDLIASEPSNPYRAGVASLYTREFYRAARDRLQPGGMFLQWLQAYEIDEGTVQTVLATLRSEFAHVEMWQTNAVDMLFVCSSEDIAYPVGPLRQRLAAEPFASALKVAWRVEDLEGFLARYLAGSTTVDYLTQSSDAPINTDDLNCVEYGFARSVGRSQFYSIPSLRTAAVNQGTHRPPCTGGNVDWTSVDDQRMLLYALASDLPPIEPGYTEEQKVRAKAIDSFVRLQLREAVKHWESQPREPIHPLEVAILALSYANVGDNKAAPLIDKLRKSHPKGARAIDGMLWQRQKKPAEAAPAIIEALESLRHDPWALPLDTEFIFSLAVSVCFDDPSQSQAMYAALEKPFALERFTERRKMALFAVAQQLGPEYIAKTVETFEPHVPWTSTFLQSRYLAYMATSHPLAEKARQDFQKFTAQESPGRPAAAANNTL